MNNLDLSIINGIKDFVFTHALYLKGSNDLFADNLGVSIIPILGLLFVGEIAVIIVKSNKIQKKYKKSQKGELIANLLAVAGVITILGVAL